MSLSSFRSGKNGWTGAFPRRSGLPPFNLVQHDDDLLFSFPGAINSLTSLNILSVSEIGLP